MTQQRVRWGMAINSILSSGMQGVQTGMALANRASGQIARSGAASDVADLTSSIVDLKIAENQVKAAAQVVKAGDEMVGSLIDTMA